MNFNPQDLMKGLQNMQGKMSEIQQQLQQIEAEGNSGGGLVTVKMNGKMEVVDVKIDPIAVDPRDVKMLEELIVSASAASMRKVQSQIQEKMASLGMPSSFSGMGL